MNKFYYLDSSNYEIMNYEIETDLNLEVLCQYIHKQALKYCDENDIDTEMYLNGECEDVDHTIQIQIDDNKKINFSLYASLYDMKKFISDKPPQPQKISIKLENLI